MYAEGFSWEGSRKEVDQLLLLVQYSKRETMRSEPRQGRERLRGGAGQEPSGKEN